MTYLIVSSTCLRVSTVLPPAWRPSCPSPPRRLTPELAPALSEIHQNLTPAMTIEMIPALRQVMAAASPSLDDLAGDGAFALSTRLVPGPSGAPDIELLIARPAGHEGPLPILYHLHGGGMVMGDNRFGLADVLPWAAEFGLLVVSVEYRLAPEHPYPAGIEDAHAGLVWAIAHGEEIDAAGDRGPASRCELRGRHDRVACPARA